MAKVSTWYCESTTDDGRLHAFCLLRSPYKKSIQLKIQDLADGHGFLSWELMKIDSKTEQEFIANNYDFDTLYVGETPKETIH